MTFLQTIIQNLTKMLSRNKTDEDSVKQDITIPCCSDQVHIAYRGISDDRLYVVYDKKWNEVRFFKPHGLRVFCAQCRRRVY